MSDDALLVSRRDDSGLLSLALARPSKCNALNGRLVDALCSAFADLDEPVVLLSSSDPRCFCAGLDLTLTAKERQAASDRLYELYEAMLVSPSLILAVVEGAAVGGGAQLALASDVRVAGPKASFRFAGPGHGLAVGSWGLPSLIGRGRALDLCLTMRTVAAEEAAELGLVERLAAKPLEAATALAVSITSLDRSAATRVKETVRAAAGVVEALALERAGNRESWSGGLEGLRRDESARG